MASKYCSDCGNQVMPTMRICPQCGGRSFSDTPVAARNLSPNQPASSTTSQSHAPASQAVSGAPNYAGFWERLAASFIDAIVVMFISFIAGIILGYGIMASGISLDSPRANAFLNLASVIVALFYYASMESGPQGGTFGKRWMGLRVVNLNYQQITTGQGVGRYFGRWVSLLTIFIGYLIQPFTARKQTLHDIMSGTLVVHSKPHPKSGMEVFATIIVSFVLIAILLVIVKAIEQSA